MNTKIISIVVTAFAVTSLSLAEPTGNSSRSAIVPSLTLQQLHAELENTQAALQEAVDRYSK